MNKFITATLLSLTMLTSALAAIPSIPPELGTTPTVEVCSINPTYEEGLADFTEQVARFNGVIIATLEADDGTLAVIVDLRKAPEGTSGVDPDLPFFVLFFDANHCYVQSKFVSQQDAQDTFGLTLASE